MVGWPARDEDRRMHPSTVLAAAAFVLVLLGARVRMSTSPPARAVTRV